jgi:hypothetical protein
VKASTLSEYRSVVDAHIVSRFDDQSIEAVTPRQVEEWAIELLASGRSRRTVNKILTMLHGLFERARRRQGSHGADGSNRRRGAGPARGAGRICR